MLKFSVHTTDQWALEQCPKLSFCFVHSQGALPLKLCTWTFLHAPSQYIAIINGSKNVHTRGAHLQKSCTRPWKCGRRVHGAPLILDTVELRGFTNIQAVAWPYHQRCQVKENRIWVTSLLQGEICGRHCDSGLPVFDTVKPL